MKEQKDSGTRQFKHPMPKKIVTVNLHNPHKAPDEKNQESPGPATYNKPRDFDVIPEADNEEEFNVPRLNHVPGGKVYVDDNNDRFGQPLRPMKPIEMKPGPGQYYLGGEVGPQSIAEKAFPVEDARTFAQAERNFGAANGGLAGKGVPGPQYYENAIKEPKKISFLFNPAEKWV